MQFVTVRSQQSVEFLKEWGIDGLCTISIYRAKFINSHTCSAHESSCQRGGFTLRDNRCYFYHCYLLDLPPEGVASIPSWRLYQELLGKNLCTVSCQCCPLSPALRPQSLLQRSLQTHSTITALSREDFLSWEPSAKAYGGRNCCRTRSNFSSFSVNKIYKLYQQLTFICTVH